MYSQEGVCFYPGRFNPPTKYHFINALDLQAQRDVSHVTILVGTEPGDVLTKEEKAEIWNIYNKSFYTGNISVEIAKDGSSMDLLMEKLKKVGDAKVFVAFDEKTSKKDETNKVFSPYKNVEYKLLMGSYDGASKKMIEYVQNDEMKKFKNILPTNMGQGPINRILNILNPKEEPVEEKSPNLKEKYMQFFDDGFWKSQLALNEVGEASNPYPWKFRSKDDDGNMFYSFNSDKNEYTVAITDNGGGSHEAHFNTVGEMGLDTNEGVAIRVISTFISIIKDFMKNEEPNEMIVRPIQTKGEDDKRRERVYKIFLEKNIPVGYSLLNFAGTFRYVKK